MGFQGPNTWGPQKVPKPAWNLLATRWQLMYVWVCLIKWWHVSLWKQTPNTERAGLDYVSQQAQGQVPHMALQVRLTGPRGLVFTSAGHTGSCAAAVLTSSSVGLMLRTPCLFKLTHASASLLAHAIKNSLITMADSSFCKLYLQHL